MDTKSSNAAFWKHHVEQCVQSGNTQAAYCREQGLIVSQMGYWYRKLNADRPGTWLPVEMKPETGSSSIDLLLAGDRCLRIAPGFDQILLKQIILAVESVS